MGGAAPRGDHGSAHRPRLRARGRGPARLPSGEPVRVFVALNLPEALRQDLWEAIEPVRERGLPVKWVRPDALHLTLKFLGDVDDAREPNLRVALGQVAGSGEARPVSLHIEGFGVFPDFRRPRIVWAGVEPDAALELLQHRVEQVFAPLGFPTEAKPFRPHLTLGRAARDARPRDFTGIESSLAAVAFTRATIVPDIDLMQSTLQSGGAVYQVKHRERLS